MSRQIGLSVIEENTAQLPEEIQRIGMEALQILWKISQDIAQKEIEAIKQRYQQYELEVLQQRDEASEKVDKIKEEITHAKAQIDSLNRENKSLQVDLNRKVGELKSSADQIHHLDDKISQQEHEIKKLTEEIGRAREHNDNLKKRLYEVSRQAEQDRAALKEATEESMVNLRTRERLDKNLKTAMLESEQVWKQLKVEQTRAAVADALVQEMKETIKKFESDIKLFKEEKQEMKETLESEMKTRIEMEKKLSSLTARSESQEWAYKDIIAKLEQELEAAKGEAATVRNRMIKAEGALEREKKAIERLETKLVAASGNK